MKTIWRNKRNEHKYVEVVRYRCGHYYLQQYMQWGNVKNKTGRNRRSRFRKGQVLELLADYKPEGVIA